MHVSAPLSRREVVRSLLLGAASAVLSAPGAAADAPIKLDVNDPTARALGYVESSSSVDSKKYPQFIQGSNCENCLKLEGKPGNNYRPCGLFPGKLVSVSGWCTGWTAEM
jgi:hypothetical protein